MLITFIAGILFAVGHHLFYLHLDHKIVSNTKYDQQMNIRIGTAFSYLVRASLGVAVSIAYWQVFWRTLLRNQLPVSAIDSLANLLGGLLSLLDFTALRANPVLFFLAAISWLIPFAAIVPPATLTVSSIQITSSERMSLPGVNFETGPLGIITYISAGGGPNPGNASGPPETGYGGSSQPLSRLSSATASQGELPRLISPIANSSYRL